MKPVVPRMLAAALFAAAGFCVESVSAERSYTSFCAGCGVMGADTFVSHSKQFVVHGRAGTKFRDGTTNTLTWINLEPQIFAITAERTKRAFLQELQAQDMFRDEVHAVVLDFMPPDRPIQLVSEIFLDGFEYRLGVPGRVEHTRLVRAVVQALLLEYANRGAKRCAELPRWLVEGMTRQVLSSTVPTYVVNESGSSAEVLGYDRLSYTRAYLSTNRPMTVQELSFYDGRVEDEERFQACAHMLVHELLQIRGGPGLLRQFLQLLPSALNWQTAFYHIYRGHFNGPLAFEKWWMLAWTDQRNRPAQEFWPLDLSLVRLNALLLTSMEFHMSTNSIPQRQDATLQEVISRADFATQRAIFSQKLQELFFASVSFPPEVLPLAQAYQNALEGYVQRRSLNQYQPGLKYDPEQRVQGLVQSTLKNLNELDFARKELEQGRPARAPRISKR